MIRNRLLVAGLAAVLVLPFFLSFSFAKTSKTKTKAKTASSKKTAKPTKSTKGSKSTKSKTSRSSKSSKSGSKGTKSKGKRMSKREREAARRAAAEARRRELERLAAIRRFDEQLRDAAAANIQADDLTFEDPQVRSVAISALGNRAGTVVVMDPNTGRVLSIVNQRMALGMPVKPCSTIKPIVALAAMAEHMMEDGDVRHIRTCNCDMEMDDAIAYSNNEYFQQLGRQLGLDRLTSYAREFGFGQTTGINMPGEASGSLPTSITPEELGRVASHGDGITMTAIQLACFTSAVANGGSLYQPQGIRPGQPITPILRRQLVIDPKHRRALLEGMEAAVDYGTARRASASFEQVAGKTGTCIAHGSWIGLFSSFSSAESPNLVVVVITRGSTSRGKYSADIAGQIYRTLSPRFGNLANRPRRVGDAPDDDAPVPTLSNQK